MTVDGDRRLGPRLWAALLPYLHKAEQAVRASVIVAICAVALGVADRLDLLLYAMFGAFTGVYGVNEPYRVRVRTVTVAGLSVLAAVAAGLLLAEYRLEYPWMPLAAAALMVPACLLIAVFGLIPPQPIFHVIAIAVCAVVPVHGDIGLRFSIAVAAAALAWAITMSGWLVRRFRPRRVPEPVAEVALKELRRVPVVERTAIRDPLVWRTIARDGLGVLIAGMLAYELHGGRPYWAMISAISVLPIVAAPNRFTRAAERIGGTLIGVLVAGGVLALHLPEAALVVVIVVCQLLIELTVVKKYGLACIFITTMVLTSLSFVLPVHGTLLAERLVETVIGSLVAVVLMLITTWIGTGRTDRTPAAP